MKPQMWAFKDVRIFGGRGKLQITAPQHRNNSPMLAVREQGMLTECLSYTYSYLGIAGNRAEINLSF